MSLRQGSPQCMCYKDIQEHTWTALGCRSNSTCKSFSPEYWHQAIASQRIHCQARQITSESPLWRDLTKVFFILHSRSWDWHVPAGNRTRASKVGGEHSSKEPLRHLHWKRKKNSRISAFSKFQYSKRLQTSPDGLIFSRHLLSLFSRIKNLSKIFIVFLSFGKFF